MTRNHKGQFASSTQAAVADLKGFISDWKYWAIQAHREGNIEEARRCMAELRDCREKLDAITA
jgi:hypothetical protein